MSHATKAATAATVAQTRATTLMLPRRLMIGYTRSALRDAPPVSGRPCMYHAAYQYTPQAACIAVFRRLLYSCSPRCRVVLTLASLWDAPQDVRTRLLGPDQPDSPGRQSQAGQAQPTAAHAGPDPLLLQRSKYTDRLASSFTQARAAYLQKDVHDQVSHPLSCLHLPVTRTLYQPTPVRNYACKHSERDACF